MRAIYCPVCGGEFNAKDTHRLLEAGAHLIACSTCGAAFTPPVSTDQRASIEFGDDASRRRIEMSLAREREARTTAIADDGSTRIPPVIYKYRAPDDRAVQILRDRMLYCGPPGGLNDPLDCQYDMKAEVLRALEQVRSDVGPNLECMGRIAHLRSVLLKGTIESRNDSDQAVTFIEQHQRQLSECGILCFSARADIAALWAHYAANHTGLCFGFDATRLVQELPSDESKDDFGEGSLVMTPVIYGIENPSYGPVVEYVLNRDIYRSLESSELQTAVAVSRITFESYFVKTASWSYEKEVRLVWTSRHGMFPFRSGTLTSVVYGLRMDSRVRSTIEEILAQREWAHVRRQEITISSGGIGLSLRDCD